MSMPVELRKAYEDRMIRLQGLINHPGWPDFVAYLQQQETTLMSGAMASDEAFKTAKLLGGAMAYKDIAKWPVQEVMATARALQDQDL